MQSKFSYVAEHRKFCCIIGLDWKQMIELLRSPFGIPWSNLARTRLARTRISWPAPMIPAASCFKSIQVQRVCTSAVTSAGVKLVINCNKHVY
jgi:hypothetical protein